MSNREIVLVSNGPLATERKMADEIESFETIVRFNNFKVKGFQEYVGTRTDIWATRICATIAPRTNKFEEIIGIINWCKYTKAIESLLPSFIEEYPQATIIYAEQSKKYSEQFGLNHHQQHLSVGLITILHLFDLGYKKIHLYAFGGSKKKHYFKLPPKGEDLHPWNLEQKFLDDLEQEGKIVRL